MEAAHHPWPALGALLLRDGLVEKDELGGGPRRAGGRRPPSPLRATPRRAPRRARRRHARPGSPARRRAVRAPVPRARDLRREPPRRCAHHRGAGTRIRRSPDQRPARRLDPRRRGGPPLVLFSDEFRRPSSASRSGTRWPARTSWTRRSRTPSPTLRRGTTQPRSTAGGARGRDFVRGDRGRSRGDPGRACDDARRPRASACPSLCSARRAPRARRARDRGRARRRARPAADRGQQAPRRDPRGARDRDANTGGPARGRAVRPPFVELDLRTHQQVEAALLLTESLAHHLSALPLGRSADGSLLVAVSDPTNVVYADELRDALAAPIRFTVVTPDEIDDAIHYVHFQADPLPRRAR